jgi:hypothetical protein
MWLSGTIGEIEVPIPVETVADFQTTLAEAIPGMRKVLEDYPDDRALKSILLQLEALKQWTANDVPPTLEQKGRLNFGLLASKFLDEVDRGLAEKIYELANFLLYWK